MLLPLLAAQAGLQAQRRPVREEATPVLQEVATIRRLLVGKPQNPRQPAPRKIEDAIVRAVIPHTHGIKLQVDVVGLDLTALIDWWHVVE